MKKYLLLTLVFGLLISATAYAGGNELAYKRVTELPTLANTSIVSGDWSPVHDLSAGKVRKVSAGILATTATAAELNRSSDLTGRVVGLTATAAITEVLHENRELYVTGTALATYTLPEATGSGARYKFTIGEVNTNNTVIVVADTTNTNFIGSVNILDLDLSAQGGFGSPANSDTMTLNGTTTGGALGDEIILIDVATDVWKVVGQLQVPTGSNIVTPFSAAV